MEETNLADLKPFEQRMYWNPDAEFTFSGIEVEKIFNTVQPWLALAFIFQGVIDRGRQEGKINIKYEYVDGSGEISEEEVKAYTEQFLKMMQAQQAPQDQTDEVAEAPKAKKSKIIVEP